MDLMGKWGAVIATGLLFAFVAVVASMPPERVLMFFVGGIGIGVLGVEMWAILDHD